MGRGGVADLEASLPGDEEALESPDAATKNEWDALHFYAHNIRREELGDTRAAAAQDRARLAWVKPERSGGATSAEYAVALQAHPQPPRDEVLLGTRADLDPTQRVALDLGRAWAERWMREAGFARGHPPTEALNMMLLGTAGTGKTYTIGALLRAWREMGFGTAIVTAYTGVAASNVGFGARTLHDTFRLGRTNAASGELAPLEGEALDLFIADLKDVRVLVIDEISMVSRLVLAQVSARLQEWRHQTGLPGADMPFGGIGVVLAGDFGQLPPVNIPVSHALLNFNVVHGAKEAPQLNMGLRLFRNFRTVVRLRRVHRQTGASMFKESLIRARDGAMTKEDHEVWREHELGGESCTFTAVEQQDFEDNVPHIFAENAPAGQRNGKRCGQHAEAQVNPILRVASADSPQGKASRAPCDMYGQLRRVVHLTEGAPVMLTSNLRTPAGLVNGALGTLVAVLLRPGANAKTNVRDAVSASDVDYAVVDFPSYTGPVIYPGHPTWVPVEPFAQRHKFYKGWERTQLPLVLAWGITIHKSQGLTFRQGCVVDFAHQPNYQPVERAGLAFVAMSRTRSYERQAFKNLPSFWQFRLVLKDKLFQLRSHLEEHLDSLHDDTMLRFFGRARSVEDDVQEHMDWTEMRTGAPLSDASKADLHHMLSQRGVLEPPTYDDEPDLQQKALKGGGGRTKLVAPRKSRSSGAVPVRAPDEDENAGHNTGMDGGGTLGDMPESSDSEPEALSPIAPLPSGWRCNLLGGRQLGQPMLTKPAWYNDARSGATSAAGSQEAASCAVFAVNNILAAQEHAPRHIDAFRRVAENDYDAEGNFEYLALSRSLVEEGFRLAPLQGEQYTQELPWADGTLGFVVHTPGHWISIVPPTEQVHGGPIAALLCDSLFTVPFGLAADELRDFFRVLGDLHAAAALAPGVDEAARIHVAAQWSAYSVRRQEPREPPHGGTLRVVPRILPGLVLWGAEFLAGVRW